MSVTPLHSWPTRTAVLVATKMKEKSPNEGKNGRTVERQAQKTRLVIGLFRVFQS